MDLYTALPFQVQPRQKHICRTGSDFIQFPEKTFREAALAFVGEPARSLWCILLGCWDFDLLPANGFSMKPQVKLFAGEQKDTLTLCS